MRPNVRSCPLGPRLRDGPNVLAQLSTVYTSCHSGLDFLLSKGHHDVHCPENGVDGNPRPPGPPVIDGDGHLREFMPEWLD